MPVASQIAAPQSVLAGSPLAPAADPDLYVANSNDNSVTVYAHGSKRLLRRISQGINRPTALAFDGSGNLYVTNAGCPVSCSPYVPSTVTVYAPGKTSVLRTISQGIYVPTALAFDGSGKLYVANYGCESSSCSPSVPFAVTVYPAGKTSLLRTIYQGVSYPRALAFDTSGNLYVLDHIDWVSVYAPGKTKVLRTISQGVVDPWAMAFDRSGNLYLGNASNVTVYAPGKTKVLRTISRGINDLIALALDRSGKLYVGSVSNPHSKSNPHVTIYVAGKIKLLRTISQGISCPNALAFDPSSNLYVANCLPDNNVTVYAPGKTSVLRTISKGVDLPEALAFGP